MARTGGWLRALRIAAWVLAAGLAAMLLAAVYLYRLTLTLPDLESAPDALHAARTSIVYAADGSVLAEWHGEQDRTLIKLDEVPKSMRDAVIVAEDDRFYEHEGIDVSAMMQAARGEGSRGASTITVQLVRMLFADTRSGRFTDKIRQALMALELDSQTSKDRVLEAYLNMVYFGSGRYGVESAARGYFGKPASQLTLAEAATLAGVIHSPSRYSPAVDPESARKRRDEVLTRMRDFGYITSEQDVEARTSPIVLSPAPTEAPKLAPYFVEYVKRQLIDELGSKAVFTGGLRVYTTLEPAVQRCAEDAVKASLPATADPEAALVAVDPRDGRIIAMVGGRDFGSAQFNLAAQGRRQPGSAFKPFLLVAALESGVSPDRTFDTSPYTVRVKDGTWHVENYENAFTRGRLTLRAATDWSVNAVFARLIMQVGPEKVVDAARRMGITSSLEPNPAIALGGLSQGVTPLEMASAYGTLATGGEHVAPTAVREVRTDHGDVVFRSSSKPERVVSQDVAATTTDMLRDVVAHGTGVAANTVSGAAGKTGTTQSYRDAWFVGYTKEMSAAVWVGYRAGQIEMLDVHGIRVTGGSYPAAIWGSFAAEAADAAQGPQAAAPALSPDIVVAKICRSSGMVANPRCPDVFEDVLARVIYDSAPLCTEH